MSYTDALWHLTIQTPHDNSTERNAFLLERSALVAFAALSAEALQIYSRLGETQQTAVSLQHPACSLSVSGHQTLYEVCIPCLTYCVCSVLVTDSLRAIRSTKEAKPTLA